MFSSSSIDTYYEENILHWFSLHEYALMLNEVRQSACQQATANVFKLCKLILVLMAGLFHCTQM